MEETARKKLRSEVEPPSDDVLAWIKAHDKLIGSSTVTVDSLFNGCTIKSFTEQKYDPARKAVATTGRIVPADWSTFRTALEARHEKSPLWFIQRRVEDLLLAPDGTIGERVESFVIVEAPHATLAPRHYIVAEPLTDADPEDHVPSRVLDLSEQDVKWNPIVKADGTSINAFIMQRATVVPAFSFGASPAAAAPAPAAAAPAAPAGGFGFGFGNVAPAPTPAAGFGFSFGAAAPAAAPAPAAGFSFSFGSAAPAPAAPAPASSGFDFGFGAAAPSASAPATAPVAAAPAPAPTARRIPVEDILFAIWDENTVEEMRQLATSGSRIVIEDFKLANGKKVKLVMQDDVQDQPASAAAEFILKKLFARQCERITSFDKWMDDCPELEPDLLEFLQDTREKMLQEESTRTEAEDGEKSYAELYAEHSPAIIAALTKAVERRQPFRESQARIMAEITQLLKERKMIPKTKCRVLKYYPSNKDIPFRPFGKVSGISGEGEEAFCEPPAYRFINPFTGKSS